MSYVTCFYWTKKIFIYVTNIAISNLLISFQKQQINFSNKNNKTKYLGVSLSLTYKIEYFNNKTTLGSFE